MKKTVKEVIEKLSKFDDCCIVEFDKILVYKAIDVFKEPQNEIDINCDVELLKNKEYPIMMNPNTGNDFDLDQKDVYKPIIPSNIPNSITIEDIMEFLNIAKNIFSKSKRVSDGIPYGMLKHGVDFALDNKLFKHYIKSFNNADNARKAKLNTYKSILTANEDYWKNI